MKDIPIVETNAVRNVTDLRRYAIWVSDVDASAQKVNILFLRKVNDAVILVFFISKPFLN